jgi:integrase/recombinase XerC
VEHLGEAPSPASVTGLKPADIRAFLAHRRRAGIESRTLMRQLAALRSFGRHLEREGHGTASAFAAIRSPKVAKGLPKPVSAVAALAMTDAGDARRGGAGALDSGARRGRDRASLRIRAPHRGGARHRARRRAGRGVRLSDGSGQGRKDAQRAQ